jgi:Skp family chaperone for outer membrane proteins
MSFANWGKTTKQVEEEKAATEKFHRDVRKDLEAHARKLHEEHMERARKSSDKLLKQWRLAQKGIYYEEY